MATPSRGVALRKPPLWQPKQVPPGQRHGEGSAFGSTAKARLRGVVNGLSVAGGLIILCIVFSIASPYFFTTTNIYRIFQQVAVAAALAIGQSFVIFTGGIDLSQGAVVAFSAVVGTTVMVDQHSIALGVLVTLAVGAGVGLANGLLITVGKLVPFIATLAMLGVASGTGLLFTGGQPVFNIPSSFYAFGSNGLWVFPYLIMVSAGVAIVCQLYSTMTRGGRYVFALGSNERAAAIAGIRIRRVLLGVYAFSGLMAGLGAVLQVAYVDSAQPSSNTDLLLEAIAAVVIGGGSLYGGEGMVWGTIMGTLLIGVLYNGTELLNISSYIQTILLGGAVVLAVLIDNWRRKARVTT